MYVAIGAYRYGVDTHWTLTGLLTLLDTRWRAVLLIATVLFYGTIHRFFQQVLNRVSKLRAGSAELEIRQLEPAGQKQKTAIPTAVDDN